MFNNISGVKNIEISTKFFEIIILDYDINKIKLDTITKMNIDSTSSSYHIKPLSNYSKYYLIIDNQGKFLRTTNIINNNIIPNIGLEWTNQILSKIDDSYLFYLEKNIDKKINNIKYENCMFGGAIKNEIKYEEKNKEFETLKTTSKNNLNILCSSTQNKLITINYNTKNIITESINNPYNKCVSLLSNDKYKNIDGFNIIYNKNNNNYKCKSLNNIITHKSLTTVDLKIIYIL